MELGILFWPAVIALALTAVLTFTLRPLAIRFELTDRPGGRKRHVGEIPLVGGIAMLISIIVGLAISGRQNDFWQFWQFVIPAAMLATVGLIDDRRGVGITTRLAAQIGAAIAMALGGGLYLRDIGDPFGTGILGLGALAIPLSVVIALTVINAFNFVDGIDGLAGSMALIALMAGAVASGLSGPPTAVGAIACGAILGFLPFNFPGFRNSRVRTFMGDSGSTLLGFIVVWFTISICQGESRSLSPVAALWFALMPLSDFFSCVARRVFRGKLPLRPGREHFHYMLMQAGLDGRQALGVLVSFAVVYAAVGLVGAYYRVPDWTLFAPWISLLGLQYYIIKRLGVLLRFQRRQAAAVIVRLPRFIVKAHFDKRRLEREREAA